MATELMCTETTMLGFTIVWIFGMVCGLLIATLVAISIIKDLKEKGAI